MDSLHRITHSLPSSRQPQLSADFKAAALAVTNLYKSAAASQDRARAAGYQDAVEDLLAFLDREDLGLGDGEGWRVRQWGTERLVGGREGQAGSDEDEVEEVISGKREVERSSSPEAQKKSQQQPPALPLSSSEVQEPASSPQRSATVELSPTYTEPQSQPQLPAGREGDFTFRSASHTYPTNHDRENNTMDLDTASLASSAPTTPLTESPATVRIISRSGRGKHANHRRTATAGLNHNNHNNPATINLNLGAGAGNKRKIPPSSYPDSFFDTSGFNFDGEGGGRGGNGRGEGVKRGRFV